MTTCAHEWFSILMRRGGMTHTVTVKVMDEREAREVAEDMYPGWRVVEIWRDDD